MCRYSQDSSLEEHSIIFHETQKAIDPLSLYSDNGHDYTQHLGWSLLTVLWGRIAPEENIDYWDAGTPPSLQNSDSNTRRVFHLDQQHVIHTVWENMAAIIAYHSPLLTVTALLAHQDSFPPIQHAADHWYEAEKAYGKHPDGFTVEKERNIYIVTAQR